MTALLIDLAAERERRAAPRPTLAPPALVLATAIGCYWCAAGCLAWATLLLGSVRRDR